MKNRNLLLLISITFLFNQFAYSQNIGINKINPDTELDIIGTTTIEQASSNSNPQLNLRDIGDGYARLKFSRDAAVSDNYFLLASRPFENDFTSRFNLYYKGENYIGNIMTITGEGKVGLNTIPSDWFHIDAGANQDAMRIQIAGATKMRLLANGGTSLGTNNVNVPMNGLYVHGNTGLGVSNATEKLMVNGNVDVTGNINFDGILLQNNAPLSIPTEVGELSDARTGGNSIFLGAASGNMDDQTGNGNTGVGDFTLRNNTSGDNNVAIGQSSSYNNNGDKNTTIGNFSNYYNVNGSMNTMIGYNAGKGTASHTKHGNIFIGASAGFHEMGSNKLYIQNNNSPSPLIYGDFQTQDLKINGDFEVRNSNTATIHNLQIPTGATDGYVLTSDGNGNATWEEGGAGGSGWTVNPTTDNVYTFENVGIGSAGSTTVDLCVGGTTTLESKIYAKTSTTSGYGVFGNTWASGYSVAVYGSTNGAASSSTSAVGVYGKSDAGVGVRGQTSGINGIAIHGRRSGTVGKAGVFEGPVEVTGKLSVGENPTNQAYTLAVDGSAAKSSGGTTWGVASDLRLKDIHGKYERGLKEINQLNTVIFNYKKDNALQLQSDNTEYGFIAQEVAEIFPEAVGKIDGNFLDFNFHPILVSMVNGIQELSKENETLKSQIRAQEERFEQLEKRILDLEKIK